MNAKKPIPFHYSCDNQRCKVLSVYKICCLSGVAVAKVDRSTEHAVR